MLVISSFEPDILYRFNGYIIGINMIESDMYSRG